MKYFCVDYDFAGKLDLSKGCRNTKKRGYHAFFGDNEATITKNNSKIQSNVWRFLFFIFFQIEALLSLKNAWFTQIFFLDTKSTR